MQFDQLGSNSSVEEMKLVVEMKEVRKVQANCMNNHCYEYDNN